NLIIPAYTNAPFLLILPEKGHVHNLFTHAFFVSRRLFFSLSGVGQWVDFEPLPCKIGKIKAPPKAELTFSGVPFSGRLRRSTLAICITDL
ncbi:hypothetical protein KHY84_01125, partial [butyrate-producing bacterium]|nr:hypothetical protein [butyrate-producing bacterium]